MDKLKIGLVLESSGDWTGGIEYIRNIAKALASLPEPERSSFSVFLLTLTTTDQSIIDSIHNYVDGILFFDSDLTLTSSYKSRFFWYVKRKIKKYKYITWNRAVFLETNKFNFIYPFSAGKYVKKLTGFAAWVPDFQHKRMSHFFSKDELMARDEICNKIEREDTLLVLSSKSVESDFRSFYSGFRTKTRVLNFRTVPEDSWYTGSSVQVREIYNIPERYFIVCNQFWVHKNHKIIFESLRLLKEQNITPVVVCTGLIHDYRSAGYGEDLHQMINEYSIDDQVFLLGLVPRAHQIQLMRGSLAVLQPSLCEGWSTVVEDARVMGKRMFLSDIDVHREQNPPESIYFDPLSAEELSAIIKNCWSTLDPGPNFVAESESRDLNIIQVHEFARTFLSIARDSSRNNG